MAKKTPQIGPVINLENDLPPVLLGDTDRFHLRGFRVGLGKMRAGDQNRAGGGDEMGVDVILAKRHIGAVFAIKDQRKGLIVLDG